jgi:uncharacterized membrane protein
MARSRNVAPLDRFSAFSDGVFAIAITILVLELPVPLGAPHLGRTLLEEWPDFLGYFISFAYIGGVWVEHAWLTRLMKAADAASYAMNLLLLLSVALLPFSTRLMVGYLNEPQVGLAVLIYGLTVLLASTTLSFLMMYVAAEPSLVLDEVSDSELRAIYPQRWVSIGVNAAALGLAFIAPYVAVALYLLQTLLLLIGPLSGFRLRRRSTAGTRQP